MKKNNCRTKTSWEPKKINEKTNDDLFRNMTSNHETHICEESESDTDYDSDDEITVEPFKYTGHQQNTGVLNSL